MKKQTDNLQEKILNELKNLNAGIKKDSSLKNKFVQGIVTGLGTFLGATVVVAFLIYILTQLASVEALRPFIQNIVEIVQSSGRK